MQNHALNAAGFLHPYTAPPAASTAMINHSPTDALPAVIPLRRRLTRKKTSLWRAPFLQENFRFGCMFFLSAL